MATIASLIIDIGANTAELRRSTNEVERMMGNVSDKSDMVATAMSTLSRAVIGAFSVQAIIGFAREVTAFSSDVVDMSAQLGMGVERVQAFGYAISGAGLTVDDIATGVGQLSKRLVEGNQSAVSALDRLGLSAKALIDSAPDEAIMDIVDAVSKIPNPMERSAIMMELFGRSGTKYLRLVTEDLRALTEEAERNGAVISAELIRKGDQLDDVWHRLWIRGKALLADVLIPTVDILNGKANSDYSLLGQIDRFFGSGFAASMTALQKGLAPPDSSGAGNMKNTIMSLHDADFAMKQLEQETKRLSAEREHATRIAEQQLAIEVKLGQEMERQQAFGKSWGLYNSMNIDQTGGLEALLARGKVDMVADMLPTGEDFTRYLAGVAPNVASGAMQLGKTIGQTIKDNVGHTFAGMSNLLVKAFTGGGGMLGAFKALGVQLADDILGPLKEKLSKLNASTFQTAIGGIAGAGAAGLSQAAGLNGATTAIIGMGTALAGTAMMASALSAATIAGTAVTIGSTVAIGAATLGIGAAAIGVALLVKHFIGLSEAEKQARKTTSEFAAALAQTLTQMQQLEVKQLVAGGASQKWAETVVSLRDAYLLAGKSIDEALDATNRLFAAEKLGGAALAGVIKEIGVVLEMAAEAQKAADAAKREAEAMQALTDAFDGTKVIADAVRLTDVIMSLGGAVHLTMAEQQRVNSQLREALEKYAALGMVAPQAMIDLELATRGVTKETEHLTKSIDEAWANIQRIHGVQLSGGEGTSEGRNTSNILAGYSFDDARRIYETGIAPGSTDQDWNRVKDQYGFAGGSHGMMDFGAGTKAILHGREEVRTARQARDDDGLREEMRQMNATQTQLIQNLPRMLRDQLQQVW